MHTNSRHTIKKTHTHTKYKHTETHPHTNNIRSIQTHLNYIHKMKKTHTKTIHTQYKYTHIHKLYTRTQTPYTNTHTQTKYTQYKHTHTHTLCTQILWYKQEVYVFAYPPTHPQEVELIPKKKSGRDLKQNAGGPTVCVVWQKPRASLVFRD